MAAFPQQIYYKNTISSQIAFRFSCEAETFCLNKGQLKLNIFKLELSQNTESSTLSSLAHLGEKSGE